VSGSLRRLGASCALLAPCAGCLQGDYNEDRFHQAVAAVEVEQLVPGKAHLGDVLALLGAPLSVVELDDGVALAYGWLDQVDWNVEAIVPVGDASMQFSYADADLQIPGLVVFLDDAYVVTRHDRGLLRDLLPDRPRPRLVEDP
jgi:hypothetical protein